MPNEHRGEVEIELGGQTRTMRATFGVIAEIETGTGQGILEIANKLSQQRPSFSDLAVVIGAGLKAASNGKIVPPSKVQAWIFDRGMHKCMNAASRLVLLCILDEEDAALAEGDSGDEDQGEAQATED